MKERHPKFNYLFLRYLGGLLFCLVGAPGFVHAAKYPAQNTNYLDSVDFYLTRAGIFTHTALSRVNDELDSISELPVSERLEALAHIGKRLEQIDVDSAMMVYTLGENLARSINDSRHTTKFVYRKGSVMLMMGLVREGIEAYTSFSPRNIDLKDKFDYFTTGHHIFDAAVDYYRVDSLKQRYSRMSGIYNDSALAYVKKGTVEESYYKALPKLSGIDYENGIAELISVMDSIEIENPLFAKAAAEIASSYLARQDWPKAKYYLALSAIGDLRAGTREATSLHRLGKLLNTEEDYSRAYDYLTHSLEAAVNSGSSMRTVEIGEIMPVVAKAGRQLEKKQTRTLIIAVIMLSIAVVIFVFIVFYAFRTRKRFREIQHKLVGMNDSKDLYIRELISLCGAYLTALENFNKLAGRKIKVGQINDLLAMIESGKVIREQLQEFFDVFDNAFLAVYPDFIDKVNELLLPDKKLSLTADGHLGPELRIVAFMRLGMDDSAQISKFLGLSLNTIYTYRNKIKARAVNRADFESDVLKIGHDLEGEMHI